MRLNRWSVIAVVVLSTLLSFPAFTWAQSTKRVRIGIPARGTAFFPLLAAQTQGLYRDEGLHSELIVMGAPLGMQILVAGEVDFNSFFFQGVQSAIAGAPVRNVMALNIGPHLVLIAKPEIRTMADLKGKVVSTQGAKTVLDSALRKMIAKGGLRPDVDVKLVPFTPASIINYNVLLGGRVDAALLGPPYSNMAIKKGYNPLMGVGEVSNVPTVGLITTVRRLRDDPRSIVGFIRATLKGARLLKANKEEFVKLLAKEERITDKEMGDLMYEEAIKFYSYTGIPSEAAVKEAIAEAKDLLGVTREVTPADVADYSYVRAAAAGS
jgi:ABC-type nitrate/sulfonate/bicarbonate transport system substrate-binding protein